MHTLQSYYFDRLVFKKIYSKKLKLESNSVFLVINIIGYTHYTLYPKLLLKKSQTAYDIAPSI